MAEFDGLITLTKVSDGQNGNLYNITSDINTIAKEQKGTIEKKEGVSFSPSSFSFQFIDGQGNNQGSESFLPSIYILISGIDEYQELDIIEKEGTRALWFERSKYYCSLDPLFGFNFKGMNEEITSEDIETRRDQVLAIKISFTKDGNVYEKIFPVQIGYSDALATFSLEADGIVGAYRDKRLEFGNNGLTVYNGGFRIKSSAGAESEEVFSVDENGNLSLKGKVNATSGQIGNIELNNGSLTGKNESFVISENGIVANNITIKSGATIDDFIRLGDSYLYNPDKHNGVVLESGKIALRDDNQIKVGNITLFGGSTSEQAYISGGNKNEANWILNDDGSAFFKEVYADQVHLQNAILEIGTTQTVGSTMIFKDSAIIEDVESVENQATLSIKFDKQLDLQSEDWILVNNKSYRVISASNFLAIVENNNELIKEGDVAIKIGKPADQNDSGFILSASGSKAVGSYAHGNSIALSSFRVDGNEPKFTKQLVLGQLDGVTENTKGIGLYAENVFLRGSLTTKVPLSGENATYAGINTLSEEKDNKFDESSFIVFWAGAEGIDKVSKAPFFVTDKGNLYAQNAKIENSLFTGTIEASEIITAKIIGNGETPALIIQDTAGGISFRDEADNQAVLIDEQQILMGTGTVIKDGSVKTDKIDASSLTSSGDNSLTIRSQTGEVKISSSAKVEGSLALQQNNIKMEYQQQGQGFDLFVTFANTQEVRL